MIVIGLTGGIGMGKSATAQLFAEGGVPIWDADAAVHRLYAPGGAAVSPLLDLVPGARSEAGGIDRTQLSKAVLEDANLLSAIEAIVHPLVAEDRAHFVKSMRDAGVEMVLCDIPLLYEGEGAEAFDVVVVVSAPEEVRKSRVLDRPGMTAEKYAAIVGRQLPDEHKRSRADFVVETHRGKDDAREQVARIMRELREKHGSQRTANHG